MCVYGDVYEETSIDQICKLAREKNQKYQKKRFQTILSSDKVNFRGHQKALMRIMDGTSRKMDTNKSKDKYQPGMFPQNQNTASEQDDRWRTKNKNIRNQEEELRKYEEKVFVEHIVESENVANRRAFSKEFDELRRKNQEGACPFYNGGEKRIFDTELNVNPFFEKMS